MRVIHCGGFGPITNALAAAERKVEIYSESFGATSNEDLFSFNPSSLLLALETSLKETGSSASQPDLLVVHGCSALAGAFFLEAPQALSVLRRLRSSGIKTIYWSQGAEAFADAPQRKKAKFADGEFSEAFDHVIQSSLEGRQLARLVKGSSWLALPAPLELFEGAGAREYASIHFSFTAALVPFQMSPLVVNAVRESLGSQKSPVTLQVCTPDVVSSFQKLRAAIESADLVIDAPDLSSYGPIGVFSLAAGRPLFCGSNADIKKEWPSQELSPVISIEPKSLSEKLRHILMEPRMLRDLGKRARNFALERHHPQRVAALSQQLYQRVVAGS